MQPKVRSQSVEAIIGGLAGQQHGAVARWQLLLRGVTEQELKSRIASGYLLPVHRGVYLVGHLATAPLAYEAAASLAYRNGAVISHRSAAKIHKLLPWPPSGSVWVTTARGDSDRKGLTVRGATLDPQDITINERIPITTPARTILDCAAILAADEDYRLEEMCAQAHANHGVKLPQLVDQIERNPGRRGVARLAKLLAKHPEVALLKSNLEQKLLKLVRESDLPNPETNQWVHGINVDQLWREQRVVVEADSYQFHSHSKPWAKDVGKTNELQLHGYIVLRFTWFDVTQRPGWVLEKIRRALA